VVWDFGSAGTFEASLALEGHAISGLTLGTPKNFKVDTVYFEGNGQSGVVVGNEAVNQTAAYGAITNCLINQNIGGNAGGIRLCDAKYVRFVGNRHSGTAPRYFIPGAILSTQIEGCTIEVPDVSNTYIGNSATLDTARNYVVYQDQREDPGETPPWTGSSLAAVHNFPNLRARGYLHISDAGAMSPKAVLQMDSTAKGFIPPRMTTAQRDAIAAPPEGLVVYNMTTHVLNVYNGTSWIAS